MNYSGPRGEMQILIEIGYSDTGYFSSYMTTACSDMDGGGYLRVLAARNSPEGSFDENSESSY